MTTQEQPPVEEAPPVETPPVETPPVDPSKGILGEPKEEITPNPEHTGVVEDGWLKGVPKEWAADASMQNLKSIEDLAKGYVHAQRMIGKDKIVMPGEYATDEERREFLYKIGLPKSQEEYKVATKEDSILPPDFAKSFAERAYNEGVMPNQAQALLDLYEENLLAETENASKLYEQSIEQTVNDLKQEYGQAYDTKITVANKVLLDVAGQEGIEKMQETGILNDKNFIKIMVKIGDMLASEDTFDYSPTSEGKLTPSEAQRKIGEIQGDVSHPYHNKSHPNHEAAVKEVTDLFKYIG